MNGAQTRFYPVGKFDIPASGYVRVSFQGAGKVSELMIGGTATTGENCYFNESNENVSQHFARRGPSVHFRYNLPRGDEYEYFYNELTVTPGNDVVGTYCMTNGFGEGYCGLQVNSKGERRILFSVWSPFETDYPNQIPPDQEVVNIRRTELILFH